MKASTDRPPIAFSDPETALMDVPIEAKSLASLLTLAADPPRYPRNITHEPLQPLTLYIVRVPGSRDVFLTPLKPPTRASVTAEAITTSLYYLHVSTAEDRPIERSRELKRLSPADQVSPATSIHRKPLPNPSHSNEAPQRHISPPKSNPDHQPWHPNAPDDKQATKYASGPQNIRLDTSALDQSDASQKRRYGPRPPRESVEPDESPIKRKPVASPDERTRAPVDSADPRKTPLVSHQDTQPQPEVQRQTEVISHDTSHCHDEPSEDLHISLIRRDPSSGVQWNIGTISLIGDPLTDTSRVEIEITTPGYQKFARENSFPMPGDIDLSSIMKTTEHPVHQSSNVDTNVEQPVESPESQYFTRRLTMPRPRSRTARSRAGSDPTVIWQNAVSKVTSPPPATRPPVYMPGLNPTQAPSKNQHFTFLSPWHGACTFSTAMDGRSLKCRHILPSTNVAETTINAHAPLVAELRFNLPWPVVNFDSLKKKDSNSDKTPGHHVRPSLADTAKHSWRNSMQKLKDISINHYGQDPFTSPQSFHSRQNSSPSRQPPPSYQVHSQDSIPHHAQTRPYSSNVGTDPDGNAHEPMDLTLGREKAGGGRGGISAKLGKLIVRDEGQKMMDLVVASSMGVWWGIHNRER